MSDMTPEERVRDAFVFDGDVIQVAQTTARLASAIRAAEAAALERGRHEEREAILDVAAHSRVGGVAVAVRSVLASLDAAREIEAARVKGE